MAEVSNHKEPIKKGAWNSIGSKMNWCQIQMGWESNDLVVIWFEIQIILVYNDLGFNGFGCQLILVVIFDFKFIWMRLPVGLRFPWFGCQLIGLRFKRSVVNEALKLKNEAFLARLPSKMKVRSSKTKLLCETSFKNEASKLKNEAFARDFLQKWSFDAQKGSVCVRLPSNMKCGPDTWLQNSNTF